MTSAVHELLEVHVRTSPIGVHVDAVELVWLLTSIVGAVLAWLMLRDAKHDCDLLLERAHAAGAAAHRRMLRLEREIAAGDVTTARLILTLELVSVLIGVVVATQETPPGGRTLGTWLVIALLLIANALTPLRVFVQRRRRRRLLGLENGS